MEFFLLSWMSQLRNYIKTRDRSSILAGALIFIPGIVFAVFALYQIIMPINEYVISGMPWDARFNDMLSGILLNIILFVPPIIMFVAAYLQAESNKLGFKICFVLSIGFLCGLVFNLADPTLLIICMFFGILATLVGFEESKKNKCKGYSPIVIEKVAVLGLRLSSIISILVIAGLVFYVVIRGAGFLSWEFLTADAMAPIDIADQIMGNFESVSIGGIRDFILGSLIIVGYCEAIAIPVGIGAAIYLSEYAPKNKVVEVIRFCIETLAGAPSIVIGLFGAVYFVRMMGMGLSAAAGGLALALMTLPWNIRTTEEAMRAVPQAYREAAYALGATKWQMIKKTVLLPASPGAITGITLGFGAAIGETAVLVYTAGQRVISLPDNIGLLGKIGTSGHSQAMTYLTEWIMNMFTKLGPGSLYNGRGTAEQAWLMENVMFSGTLVLLIIFFGISIAALILRNYLVKKTRGAT